MPSVSVWARIGFFCFTKTRSFKMKKRALVSLVLLTFVTVGAAFAQSATLDKLKFAVSGNDQTVTMANTSISGAVVIPDTYNNKPVNRIGVNGFRNCSAITSVTIPASVTSIASAAFNGCTNLTSVTFGGSNTSFSGTDAFPSNSGNELRDKYKAGGAGTYTRSAGGTVWTKQASASAPAPAQTTPAQTTPAQTAQGQGKYYLEIYNISEATTNALDRMDRDSTTVGEDLYFAARTASGTSLRSKDQNLTYEQARQKLAAIGTTVANDANGIMQKVQQSWIVRGWANQTGTQQFRIFFWIRRTE
jgi:hypothetical protein